jgi:uncharacterized protein (TIGR00106 family)
MPIVEVSVVPVGTGSTGVSRYVRAAVDVVRKSGLEYSVSAMGTCLQGDWDSIFATVRQIHDTLAEMGCARLVTTMKIDDRRDKAASLEGKVTKALGRPDSGS